MEVVKNPYTNPEVDPLDETQRHAYVVRCAQKQLGLSEEDATACVKKLSAEAVAEVREAGRCGDVARVRELLDPQAAEPAAAKAAPKGKGKHKADTDE